MLGSTGPRMMRIGLPHVELWNAWWSDYGNTVEGFTALRDNVEASAAEVGRSPGEVGATVAVLVQLEGGVGRIMGDGDFSAAVPPVRGDPSTLAEHLSGLAAAGAVHVMLVLDPITEHSIEVVGAALAQLDAPTSQARANR